eukprot:gene23607-26720_t
MIPFLDLSAMHAPVVSGAQAFANVLQVGVLAVIVLVEIGGDIGAVQGGHDSGAGGGHALEGYAGGGFVMGGRFTVADINPAMLDVGIERAAKRGIDVADIPDGEHTKALREMLSRTLSFAVASLLSGTPALVAEAEALGAATKEAHTEAALSEIALRLKQLCYQIELKSGDTAEQQELLLRLFRLLLENVSELLDDDSWLRGQIDAVQALIAGPLDQRALEDATRSLKDVIYKQSQLKHSLSDVKLTVKNMMMTFIDRLGQVAASTGDFHEKIGGYSAKISQAENITELNQILDEVLKETRIVQGEALKARDNMVMARQEVQDAEARIHQLEAKR